MMKKNIFGAIVLALLLSVLPWQPAAAQSRPVACTSGYAVWGNNRSKDETLVISGSSNTISGAARSNADFRISGSTNRITGAVEYVTLFQDGGDRNVYPTPVRVSASNPPITFNIADFRPNGRLAQAAGGNYRVINGDFDVAENTTLNGLYYVTGKAKLAANGIRGTFTVVAEDTIDVSGSNHNYGAFTSGLLFFSGKNEVGASVIKLAGSNSVHRGAIYGPGGQVELSGSSTTITGLVVGDTVKINGSSLTIAFSADACGGQGGSRNPPQRPQEPPARIVIGDDDVSRTIVVENNVTFVVIAVTVRNTGGKARDAGMWLRLCNDGDDDDDDDDDDRTCNLRFQLVDVTFTQGQGYVMALTDRFVRMGMGRNNIVDSNNTVTVITRYRVIDGIRDDDDDGFLPFVLFGQFRFRDSEGGNAVVLPAIQMSVPFDDDD
jgi:hypothetical protein